jgi:hypothetical protein
MISLFTTERKARPPFGSARTRILYASFTRCTLSFRRWPQMGYKPLTILPLCGALTPQFVLAIYYLSPL